MAISQNFRRRYRFFETVPLQFLFRILVQDIEIESVTIEDSFFIS